MSVASLVSSISGYLPAGVRDAAGLSPQISEAVRHITWLSLERALWPPEETPRQLLVVGYTDGFQLWDLQDPTAAKELVSKYDKAVLQARLLPLPLLPASEQTEPGESFLGVSAAPLMAYLHKGSPALVRLFSLRSHDDVHLLRLTEPARSLQAGRRFFAVGFAKQVELYDALQFHALFSVQCHGAAGPTFALSHRWLAYNLPPHVMVSTGSSYAGPQPGLPGKPRLPAVVKDGLEYLGQVGQRTLDQVLMPPTTAPESASQGSASLRSGSVAVRDVETQTVISQFEDHAEAVECMVWDPSGLQLVTCAALGHRILVHRAVLGKGHALTLDSGKDGAQLGSLTFQHVFTLSRGLTPAVISNIAISDDSQFVAVSSAKGTTHVFRLPSFHSHRHQLLETGAVVVPGMAGVDTGPVNLSVCTRVRLGSVLLQEGLMPHSSFFVPRVGRGTSSGPTFPWIYVATRAGSLTVYSLHLTPSSIANTSTDPGEISDGPGSEEWSTCLQRETRICRPLRHFNERRLSARDGETTSARSGPPRSGAASASAASPRRGSPRHGSDLSPAATTRSDEGVSKWLAFAETATHVSTQVPLWLCPQLRVFAYPPDVNRDHLNASLRAGEMVPGRREIEISRSEHPSETVLYHGETASGDDLRQLFGGALGAAVGEESSQALARPRLTLSGGWPPAFGRPGAIDSPEDPEDDWVKA
ncbi:ATG18H [Symbiodinium microadriaticum]|nr:ATG18H [Symbiodinium microadriaticum]